MVTWSHVTNTKALYLHFHNTYKYQNLAEWWLRSRGSHLPSHMLLWSYSHVMSHGKIKTFYLHFHKTCKHHTWAGVDLVRGAPYLPNHMSFWLCFHMVSYDKMTLYLHSHKTYKHETWHNVDLFKELSLTNSHVPLMWSRDLTWQNRNVISPLP